MYQSEKNLSYQSKNLPNREKVYLKENMYTRTKKTTRIGEQYIQFEQNLKPSGEKK